MMEQTNLIGGAIIFFLLAADLYALFSLTRKRTIPPTARAVWALVILLFPALGVIAFIFGTQNGGSKG